jgi:hypothetical protein
MCEFDSADEKDSLLQCLFVLRNRCNAMSVMPY